MAPVERDDARQRPCFLEAVGHFRGRDAVPLNLVDDVVAQVMHGMSPRHNSA
jgi:hypothetical protein